ncbi:hypothetical protein [Thiomicrorhabdus cannonii]|uniref:hypothetical protein n=1 Tax=Thiomicrorhabdus cannonii TaxID=2748011 RepID=UPI0015BC8B6F|nr:hypothetical protein [Thiomicrorhabdus cannonii]
MEWIEDNSETESWSFNRDVVLPDLSLLQRINDTAQSHGPDKMIQILASRLMEREVLLELKKLGLKVSPLSEVIGDSSPDFEMIQPLLEKNMMLMVSVNEDEHALLKKKINEFSEDGIAVLMFSSAGDVDNPLNDR